MNMKAFEKLMQGSEARLKAECQLPAYTLAMLRILLDKGVLDDKDVDRLYELTDRGAETLFVFFEACIETTMLEEGDPEDEAKAKTLALKIVETARWLLKQPINPAMREQLVQALKESELQCAEAAKDEVP